MTCVCVCVCVCVQVMMASVITGVRWSTAQLALQKEELGESVS